MIYTTENLAKLNKLLKGKGTIIGHQSPDGDSIGSSMGLHHYLKAIGIQTTVIAPDPFPDFLSWMEGISSILIDTVSPESVKKAISESDFIFTLDFNDVNRLGDLGEFILTQQKPIIMIDHHQSPKEYADLMLSDPSCGSTSELICQLIHARGDDSKISLGAAQALYCGMMTDTGSFRFSSVSAETHRCVARLMEVGLRPHEVHENVFDNQSYEKLKLMGFVLAEKLTTLPKLSAAYITLSSDEAKRFNCKKGDTEGLVNYALSVKGIRVAAFFREDEGKVKISFRSKGDIKMNELAGKYFSGGGHINAAGGKATTIDDAVKLFIEKLPEFIDA